MSISGATLKIRLQTWIIPPPFSVFLLRGSRAISIADLNYLANFARYRLYTNRDFSYLSEYLNCTSNLDAAVSLEFEHEIRPFLFFFKLI